MRPIFTIAIIGFLLCGCGEPPVCGGSSDHGNARVAGIITDRQGIPLSNAIVELFPDNYNHSTDSLRITAKVTTTNENGYYTFDSVSSGIYTISGKSKYGDAGFVKKQICVDTSIIEDTLLSDQFGSIYIEIDSLHLTKGMVLYFPGLKTFHIIDDQTKIVFSQVPCGLLQLKVFDPLTDKSFDLGREFLSIEIIPGRTLILPSRSPKPFCVKNDSITTCSRGFVNDTFNISIIKPSICIEGTWVYRISWGDGTISDWTSEMNIRHRWAVKGIYPVQSQVLFQGQYLAWSDPTFIEIIDR
jgi:hypothetical protein